MSYISTPFIFQLDVDFLPQYGLHESLMNYIIKLNISESDKVALIVPAFETERYRYFLVKIGTKNRAMHIIIFFTGLSFLLTRMNFWSSWSVAFYTLFVTMFGLRGTLPQITVIGGIRWNHTKYVYWKQLKSSRLYVNNKVDIIVGFLGTRFRTLHRGLKKGASIRYQIHRFWMEQGILPNTLDGIGLQVRSVS